MSRETFLNTRSFGLLGRRDFLGRVATIALSAAARGLVSPLPAQAADEITQKR
jgi:hypothetical protein